MSTTNHFPTEQVRSLFAVAGLPVLALWELANQYWPRPQFEEGRDHESLTYAKLCLGSPWWLVKTPYGLIEIGWRKFVINIDWSDTGLRAIDLTADDTTKSYYVVHAWSELKAGEYLTTLCARLADRAAASDPLPL